MSEHLKPLLYSCIVCGQKSPRILSCDNPDHQEIAAEMMDTNAGIPTMTPKESSRGVEDCEVYDWIMSQPEIPANHLMESPIGMDVK